MDRYGIPTLSGSSGHKAVVDVIQGKAAIEQLTDSIRLIIKKLLKVGQFSGRSFCCFLAESFYAWPELKQVFGNHQLAAFACHGHWQCQSIPGTA